MAESGQSRNGKPPSCTKQQSRTCQRFTVILRGITLRPQPAVNIKNNNEKPFPKIRSSESH